MEFPRSRESAEPASLLFSRCHEKGEDRPPDGRQADQAKIDDHERERRVPPPSPAPREYRYFLGGLQDQTCNLYIAPYLPTYLPVARTSRKRTDFFTAREGEECREEGRSEGQRSTRATRGPSKGNRGRFFPPLYPLSLSFSLVNCVSHSPFFVVSLPFYTSQRRETGPAETRGTIAYANYEYGSTACRMYIRRFLIHIFGRTYGYRIRLLDNDGQLVQLFAS